MFTRISRPFGVNVIILLILLSVLLFLSVPLAIAISPALSAEIGPVDYTLIDVTNALWVPAQLATAWGLLRLRRWAWVLVMFRVGFSLLLNLYAHFSATLTPDYLVMVGDVVIVFYLNQRDVQRAFGYFSHDDDVPEAI